MWFSGAAAVLGGGQIPQPGRGMPRLNRARSSPPPGPAARPPPRAARPPSGPRPPAAAPSWCGRPRSRRAGARWGAAREQRRAPAGPGGARPARGARGGQDRCTQPQALAPSLWHRGQRPGPGRSTPGGPTTPPTPPPAALPHPSQILGLSAAFALSAVLTAAPAKADLVSRPSGQQPQLHGTPKPPRAARRPPPIACSRRARRPSVAWPTLTPRAPRPRPTSSPRRPSCWCAPRPTRSSTTRSAWPPPAPTSRAPAP
jgi:hypothetical protein